jgi:hypothetical protein
MRSITVVERVVERISAIRVIVAPWPPPPEVTSRSSRAGRSASMSTPGPTWLRAGRGASSGPARTRLPRPRRSASCSPRPTATVSQPRSHPRPGPGQVPRSRPPRGVDPGGTRGLYTPHHRASPRRGKIRKLGADSLDALYTALKRCSRLCRRLPRTEHYADGEHACGARRGPLRDHRTTRPHACDGRCHPHVCRPMNAAHCPGRSLQPERCFASRCAGRTYGAPLTPESLPAQRA